MYTGMESHTGLKFGIVLFKPISFSNLSESVELLREEQPERRNSITLISPLITEDRILQDVTLNKSGNTSVGSPPLGMYKVGLVATKPVFGISDKSRLKPVS